MDIQQCQGYSQKVIPGIGFSDEAVVQCFVSVVKIIF